MDWVFKASLVYMRPPFQPYPMTAKRRKKYKELVHPGVLLSRGFRWEVGLLNRRGVEGAKALGQIKGQ